MNGDVVKILAQEEGRSILRLGDPDEILAGTDVKLQKLLIEPPSFRNLLKRVFV